MGGLWGTCEGCHQRKVLARGQFKCKACLAAAEGFAAIEDFRHFMWETGLQAYAKAPHLFYHEFTLVRRLG